MKAVPYGLLADVDVSSHPHVPSNDAGRGQICVVPGPSRWLCSVESV